MKPVWHFFSRHFLLYALAVLMMAGCVDSRKSTPEASVTSLFDLLQKQHYGEAYDDLSFALQAIQNKVAFEAVARDVKLGEFTTCTWTTDSTNGKEAVLTGQFTGKKQESYPLQALMVKQSGEWKLYSLRSTSPAAPGKWSDIFERMVSKTTFNESFSRKIPDENETRALVSETMQKFNESLHKKNFHIFYDYVAMLWQVKATPDQVDKSFKSFIDENVVLDFIQDTKAIFNETPRLNAEGFLEVSGYYPTQPNRVIFDLKYVYEIPRWRLVGITLNVTP